MPQTKKFVSPVIGRLLKEVAEEYKEENSEAVDLNKKEPDVLPRFKPVKIQNEAQEENKEPSRKDNMKWYNKPLFVAFAAVLLTLTTTAIFNSFVPRATVNSNDIREIKGSIQFIETRLSNIERSMVTDKQLNDNTLIILEAIDKIGE